MNHLSEIDILDVANRLGLQLYSIQGGRQYTTQCWQCDDKNSKGHLAIRPDKGVFRCPRCGYSGNAWTMANDFLGEDRAKNLLKQAGIFVGQVVVDNPAAPIQTRDAVYNAFLDKLVLAPRHRENLNHRGLTDDKIDQNGYKSAANWDSTEGLCHKLMKEGYSLKGIPGFHKDKYSKWVFMTLPGFLIPVRDGNNLIQGMQIRVEDSYLKKRGDLAKYIWFSSAGKNDGCSSGAPVHVVAPAKVTPDTKLWITEGPLKADIASLYMGLPFLGVAGVSLYKKAAQEASSLGIKKAILAYDADLHDNEHVKNAEVELIKELRLKGINALPVTWGKVFGKGIDDVVKNVASDGVYSVGSEVLKRIIKINKQLLLEIEVSVEVSVKVNISTRLKAINT